MQSPIRFVMDGLEDSIFTIAPERKYESEAALNNFDLIYLSDRAWGAFAKPADREIFISRGAVELIWSASLAHNSYYTRLIAGRNLKNRSSLIPNRTRQSANR
jgi:hypothetical protein